MHSLALNLAAEKTDGKGFPWETLPSLLWILLAIVLLLTYKDELRAILETVSWRIRAGAPVKLLSFEIGQSYVPQGIDVSNDETTLESRHDDGDERLTERQHYYLPNRRIFLVHRIAPTKTPEMLYDIALYLVPHKEATLASVARVEYFFGKYWGSRIFISHDRARSFLVATSAYGPFVCTAKLCFTDGTSAIVARYVDFEMGTLGLNA